MFHTIAGFDRIGEENAFAVLARATELQGLGRDIINLGIGQPDFRTPDHIVEAAVKASGSIEGWRPFGKAAPAEQAKGARRDEADRSVTLKRPRWPL